MEADTASTVPDTAAVPSSSTSTKKRDTSKTPQELVSEFWDKFFTKKPGKVTSIFPRALYATLLPPSQPRGLSTARNAQESYEAAAAECRERVRRIVRECNRTNEKFTDPDFDIEADYQDNCLHGLVRDSDETSDSGDAGLSVSAWQLRDSLNTLVASKVLGSGAQVPLDLGQMRNYINDGDSWGAMFGANDTSRGPGRARGGPKHKLSAKSGAAAAAAAGKGGVKAGESYMPGSVHRLDWVFESPRFTVDGYDASDIKQGGNGDCWWLAAVATIAHRRELMERVCVARDEECGVYGFVFQRDGEWISTVVDDNLYLKETDFDQYGDTYDPTGKRAREHRKQKQTGSDALYFAKCADPNETWLPLLEKAYAKVHGDYEAISGGWCGEAVEDMTGGVTTTVATNRVLKKDKLWKELTLSDGEFVFALSAIGTGWDWQKGGLALGHAYSLLQAREEVDEHGHKVRLVQVRNPWGERASNGTGEWNGPWSDGSKEWTPYWLKKLGHTFGDDGVFWMTYTDMLETFRFMHRTRLFNKKWTVVQQWTSINIGWVSGYLNTKFLVEVKKAGMVVFVLTQLDERYYRGLEGQYEFQLHFLLQAEGGEPGEHICRVRPVHDWENRSVSCEVELEPGRYEVVPKITATRNPDGTSVEDVVKEWAGENPQKLRQVGMQYDLAHAKGGVPDEDELLVKRKEEEKAKLEAKKEKMKWKRKIAKAKAKAAAMADAKAKQGAKKQASAAAASSAVPEKKSEEEDEADTSEQEDSADEALEGLSDELIEEESSESEGESDSDSDSSDDSSDEEDDDSSELGDGPPPWNAVSVVGLRVYARDPNVSIELVKPKTPEETASLTIEGEPAGATH